MKKLFLISILAISAFSCQKDLSVSNEDLEGVQIAADEAKIYRSLEKKHEEYAIKFQQKLNDPEYKNREERFNNQILNNVTEAGSELKGSKLYSIALKWFADQALGWAVGKGLDVGLEQFVGKAADANVDYTKLLANNNRELKILDGDSYLANAKIKSRNFQYTKAHDLLETALANYLTALPNSAAHLLPCLTSMELVLVNMSTEKNGKINFTKYRKHMTWLGNNYREALEKIDKYYYSKDTKKRNYMNKLISDAGMDKHEWHNVFNFRSKQWEPLGRNKYRNVPANNKFIKIDGVRMNNGFLITSKHKSYAKLNKVSHANYFKVWKSSTTGGFGVWYEVNGKSFKRLLGKTTGNVNGGYNKTIFKAYRKPFSYNQLDYCMAFIPIGQDEYQIRHESGYQLAKSWPQLSVYEAKDSRFYFSSFKIRYEDGKLVK